MSGGLIPKRKKGSYPIDPSLYSVTRTQTQDPQIAIPVAAQIDTTTLFPSESPFSDGRQFEGTITGVNDTTQATATTITQDCIARFMNCAAIVISATALTDFQVKWRIQRAGSDIVAVNRFLSLVGTPIGDTIPFPNLILKKGDLFYIELVVTGTNVKYHIHAHIHATII
jgi:hypothetical protein